MSSEKEGILNICEAARVYNLPYTTLQRRLRGVLLNYAQIVMKRLKTKKNRLFSEFYQ
jgi:hypothetical protein